MKLRMRLPATRWKRALIWLALACVYLGVMWYVVFPWLARVTGTPTLGTLR